MVNGCVLKLPVDGSAERFNACTCTSKWHMYVYTADRRYADGRTDGRFHLFQKSKKGSEFARPEYSSCASKFKTQNGFQSFQLSMNALIEMCVSEVCTCRGGKENGIIYSGNLKAFPSQGEHPVQFLVTRH